MFFTYKDPNTTTNVSDTREVLNKFFVTIADGIGQPITVCDNNLIAIYNCYRNHVSVLKIREVRKDPQPFNFKTVSARHVQIILRTLNGNKSTGLDGDPPKYVKMSPKSLSYHLYKYL